MEDSPSPELLSMCLNAFYALAELDKPQMLVKAAFELRAACIAGYTPMLDGCAVCGASEPDRFHVMGGVLQCAGCLLSEDSGVRLPVHAGTLAAMRYISNCDLKRLFSFQLGDQSLKELSDASETYLLAQLERGFFTLDFYKSLRI